MIWQGSVSYDEVSRMRMVVYWLTQSIMATQITIPHNFQPRSYQIPLMRAMDNWTKKALIVFHRRAWKDLMCWNYMIKRAIEEIGNYYYIFPTYSQGKKAIRDAITSDWFRIIDHAPKQIVKARNGSDMKLELINWSTIQIVGTDGNNIDRLVGTNPRWLVYSEFALQNPRARSLMRPIIAVNNWWVIFNSTPRGKNHLYSLYNMAKYDKTWFTQVLTVDGTWVVNSDVLEQEKKEMDIDMFNQEYYCSFEAGIMWSYYARYLDEAREQERITKISEDKALDTYTAWDLWMADSTSIWIFQIYGREIRVLESMENSWEWLAYYVNWLREKGYNYKSHFLPHDVQVRELWTWMTREAKLRELWLWNIQAVPKLSVAEWIEAVRRVLPLCWFDRDKCSDGLTALNEYHKKRDEKRKTFTGPNHDWSSHYADWFRYLSVAYENILQRRGKRHKVIDVQQPR